MFNLRVTTSRFVGLVAGAAAKRTPQEQSNVLRTFWQLAKPSDSINHAGKLLQNSAALGRLNPSCGAHSQVESQLVEFLHEEIEAERGTIKGNSIPKQLNGFNVTLNGAQVELTKENANEKIRLHFNVNHSISTGGEEDADIEAQQQQSAENAGLDELISRPQFEVEITRGITTLSFTCNFMQDGSGSEPGAEFEGDAFSIDAVSIYEGEFNEQVYAVSGEVLQGDLYDLFLNLLADKGINNAFAHKLTDLATAHEHSSYVKLLENIAEFAGVKA